MLTSRAKWTEKSRIPINNSRSFFPSSQQAVNWLRCECVWNNSRKNHVPDCSANCFSVFFSCSFFFHPSAHLLQAALHSFLNKFCLSVSPFFIFATSQPSDNALLRKEGIKKRTKNVFKIPFRSLIHILRIAGNFTWMPKASALSWNENHYYTEKRWKKFSHLWERNEEEWQFFSSFPSQTHRALNMKNEQKIRLNTAELVCGLSGNQLAPFTTENWSSQNFE